MLTEVLFFRLVRLFFGLGPDGISGLGCGLFMTGFSDDTLCMTGKIVTGLFSGTV